MASKVGTPFILATRRGRQHRAKRLMEVDMQEWTYDGRTEIFCLSCCPSDQSIHMEATSALGGSQPAAKCRVGTRAEPAERRAPLVGNCTQRLLCIAKTFSELPCHWVFLPNPSFHSLILQVSAPYSGLQSLSTYFCRLLSSSFTSISRSAS